MDADAHVGEDILERLDDFGALRRILHPFDMKVNEALTQAADRARALEAGEPARKVTLDDKHRVNEQANIETASIEFTGDGIDQERHVVVDDLKHGNAVRRGNRLETYLGHAGFALSEERPRSLGDAGKLVCAVAFEILRHCKAEQSGDKTVGDAARTLG